jgi:hypothetical protein
MTVNIQLLTVTASIAALTFPGVTVLDVGGVPNNLNLVTCRLYPNPDGLVRQWITEKGQDSRTFGTDGNEQQTAEYNLRYRYWHCAPLGTGGIIGENLYSALLNIVAIMSVFTTRDTVTGCKDLRLVSMSDFPIMVKDPSGNDGWGCDFTLHIIEYIS